MMEFLLPPFNALIIFFIVAIVFISILLQTLKKKHQNSTINKKFPPGPWKLPLIGNIHQLLGRGLPHRVLGDLAKKHGPLMQLQLGEIPIVIVSSARLAKELLKTKDPIFAGRPQFLVIKVIMYNSSDIVFRTYDDYWRQMRKICVHELLNAKQVRSLEPVRKEEGDRLITIVQNSAGESFNLTEHVPYYAFKVICKAAFGNVCKDEDVREFIKLLNQFAIIAGGYDLADLFPSFKVLHPLSPMLPKLLKLHKKIDTFFENIVNEHIQNNFSSTKACNGEGDEEDLIDTLLRVKENSNLKFPITNTNIKAIIFDLFGAGTETTTTTVIWAMSELMRNPRVMAKAQSEIRGVFIRNEYINEAEILDLKYLNFVTKETLRLHPPLPLLVPRECMEDCVVDGYTIPAKTKLMVNAWAIGRDPELWHDPDSFIPERFEDNMSDFTGKNFEFIPFGAGRRICPGITLGLANVKIPLALLLCHFDWGLPGGLRPQDLDMTESEGMSCTRNTNLCLIPTLRYTFANHP